MFPPAPAITYTFPATFLTTSSTCDVNLGSSTLLLKPRLSGIRPPVGICCWAVTALTKKTAKVNASTALFIIPLEQTNERLTLSEFEREHQRHKCLLARRAPSRKAWNFAHTTVG